MWAFTWTRLALGLGPALHAEHTRGSSPPVSGQPGPSHLCAVEGTSPHRTAGVQEQYEGRAQRLCSEVRGSPPPLFPRPGPRGLSACSLQAPRSWKQLRPLPTRLRLAGPLLTWILRALRQRADPVPMLPSAWITLSGTTRPLPTMLLCTLKLCPSCQGLSPSHATQGLLPPTPSPDT